MSEHEPTDDESTKEPDLEPDLDEAKQFIHDLNLALDQEIRAHKKKHKKKEKERESEDLDKASSWNHQKPSVIHMKRLESFDRFSLGGKRRASDGVTGHPIQGRTKHGEAKSIDNSCTDVVASISHATNNKAEPRRATENKSLTKTSKPAFVKHKPDIIKNEGDPRFRNLFSVLKNFPIRKLPCDPVFNLQTFVHNLKRATLTSNPYMRNNHGIPEIDMYDRIKSGGSRAMLKTMGVQAGILALNDLTNEGFFDSRLGFVRLAQSLAFSVYFQKNVRDLFHYAMASQHARVIKENVSEFVNESLPHVGVGVSLVALNDMQEGWLPEDTVFSLGCVALLGCMAIKDKGLL